MPDMNENSETQQEYFGKTTGKDYRVKANIKWADENKNNQMYCKLNAMINQWEIKEK